jgi:hypothetical protein
MISLRSLLYEATTTILTRVHADSACGRGGRAVT